MEARHFLSFYFGFIESSYELSKLVENNIDEKELKENQKKVISYNFSIHRQFINEIYLSRAVETFEYYILCVLREIFRQKPEILKSDKKIEISTLIELKTPEELINHITEKQIYELGYKPLEELNKWIFSKTGLNLFKDNASLESAKLAIELRNIIAHNDCKTNDILVRRLGKSYSHLIVSKKGKVLIADNFLRECTYHLDATVFDFDEKAVKKFKLKSKKHSEKLLRREVNIGESFEKPN